MKILLAAIAFATFFVSNASADLLTCYSWGNRAGKWNTDDDDTKSVYYDQSHGYFVVKFENGNEIYIKYAPCMLELGNAK